jgi:hypothetical protein
MTRKPGDKLIVTPLKPLYRALSGASVEAPRQWDGVTRREFLQAGTVIAGLGIGLGLGSTLTSCSSSDNSGNGNGDSSGKLRTYVFDFSQMDTSNHDLVMVAGTRHILLNPATASELAELRTAHPILELLPDTRITHWIRLEMPTNGLQLCYCQRFSRAVDDGSWDMVMQFYHFPTTALHSARERALATRPNAPVPVKWGRHGVTAAQLAELADPVGEDMLKDSTSTATAMVAGHPEVACFQADTAAYIQNSIVGTQPQTQQLGEVIDQLGPATPQSDWQQCGSAITSNPMGWATLVPVCNPDTNQQAINSQTGAKQYVPVWAAETNVAAKDAITPALTTVKADTTLGANVTTPPTSTEGIIWTEHDGTTTVDQTTTNGQVANSDLGYITKDQSPGHGFSVTVTGVESGSSPFINITVKNWFVRYLSLYLRFLDDNGDPISIDTLDSDGFNVQQLFPLQPCCGGLWNGTYDIFLDMLSPEYEILGIPLSSTSASYSIPMPESATSVVILAGGMGNQSKDANPYYDTTIPGATLTGLFDLAIPSLFLSLNAAAGIAGLTETMSVSSTLVDYLPTILDLFADLFDAVGFGDPAAFESLGVDIGGILLSKAAGGLDSLIAASLSEGETEEDLLDAVPVIGTFLAAISCIGTVSQMAQTSAQVAQSPSTYFYEITLTHDIEVTINPPGPQGFPSTATYYSVLAQFDGNGTPTTITQQMPGTTVTEPLVVTFKGVPLGGLVTVNVGFYSDNQWLAGQGSVGPVLNLEGTNPPLKLAIDTTENQVPLLPTTVYSHKEVIVLNASGEHEWLATTTPPSQTSPSGCNPVNGDLCALTGIAVNTTGAGVGYTWQSYNNAVTNCSNGALAQLYQFANISTTQDPESDYLFSGCGFDGPVRVVYDLLGNPDYNFYLDTSTTGPGFSGVIRQIRLSSGNAGFDGPNSNKAWGKLQFPSDALLLHPAGQIISIHSAVNKIEVISLPNAAVADDTALLSQAYGGTGTRPGLLNGPVLAALAPDGTLLVLESINNRIQAFDLNANAVPMFGGEYSFPLKEQAVGAYLSFAVEYTGYMYVLWKAGDPSDEVFTLDLYTPQGQWLSSTTGLIAAQIAVSYWRDIYAENFQVLQLPNGTLPPRTEPSISHWIPSTP